MGEDSPSGGTALLKRDSKTLRWLFRGVSTAALGAAVWAHSLLFNHSYAIAVQGEDVRNLKEARASESERIDKRFDRQDAKIDEIIEILTASTGKQK